MIRTPAFPCPEPPRAVEALSPEEVDREFEALRSELRGDVERAQFAIPVVMAAAGISLTRSRREAILEAKRGGIRYARRSRTP